MRYQLPLPDVVRRWLPDDHQDVESHAESILEPDPDPEWNRRYD